MIKKKVYLNTDSEKIKEEILKFMSESPCSDCKGQRLKPESLSVFVLGKNIMEATSLSIDKCYEWINKNAKETKKLSSLNSFSWFSNRTAVTALR